MVWFHQDLNTRANELRFLCSFFGDFPGVVVEELCDGINNVVVLQFEHFYKNIFSFCAFPSFPNFMAFSTSSLRILWLDLQFLLSIPYFSSLKCTSTYSFQTTTLSFLWRMVYQFPYISLLFWVDMIQQILENFYAS